jgi:hypothetical protein
MAGTGQAERGMRRGAGEKPRTSLYVPSGSVATQVAANRVGEAPGRRPASALNMLAQCGMTRRRKLRVVQQGDRCGIRCK